ncbi:phosphatidate phosphatase LPIN2-like isoform X2 [Lineus longissimus]|uniref:phosphatidate phosphatase LPIN2-like isoform X2 n=1 Tax=Lineus longissimus TaxID=88925 RepID=UPI002B4D88A5
MNYIGRLFSNVRGYYNEINSATLTGAIDVVVVEQEDGSLICSPFHVRFGKIGVLRSREKVVDIEVNGQGVGLHMKLGEAGEAFFVEEAEDTCEVPSHLATSPLPPTAELMREGVEKLHREVKGEQERKYSVAESEISTTSSQHSQKESESSLDSKQDSGQYSEFRPIFHDGANAINQGIARPRVVNSKSMTLDILKATSSQHVGGDSDDETENSGNKKPRRTKKRVGSKKRKNRMNHQEKVTGDLSSAVESSSSDVRVPCDNHEEGVFEMDNEDDIATPVVNLPRTISLPIIEENKMEMTEGWASSQYVSAFHPFSDGDLTPIVSPAGSRPSSPKSDTEFEKQKCVNAKVDDSLGGSDVKWQWGELPELEKPLVKKDTVIEVQTEEEKKAQQERESTGGLFQFMRKTKKIRHNPEHEGIYLDDLNLEEMDPEVAALYLYHPKGAAYQPHPPKDEDSESGRGASLPQSPVSIEGAKSSYEYDSVENKQSALDDSGEHLANLAMSLCGGLKEFDGEMPLERFMQGLVTYDDFCENPNLISNPDLVLRIGEKYYNWPVAGPMIMSLVMYQRPLPEGSIETLVKAHFPKKERQKRGMSSWFSWRSRTDQDAIATGEGASKKERETGDISQSPSSSIMSSPPDSPQKTKLEEKRAGPEDDGTSSETDSSEKDLVLQVGQVAQHHLREKYRKAVRLSSEQLRALNLQEGRNEVTYSVTTAYQGTTKCTSYIYKWRYDDRIIISDIDGTITKSDVLGQLLPMVGKDWSQTGVAQLFTNIANNGYKFLYLSARAIGQSTATRYYLNSIKQGEVQLPDGPLLLSPSSLISAFHREVIERKPEEFKIGCLRDVAALFPSSRNPFYAGYGNKINDVWAYRAVGIPISRIFTINHRGELRHELTHTFQSSYTDLCASVGNLFPDQRDRKNSDEFSFGGRVKNSVDRDSAFDEQDDCFWAY